MVMRNPPAAVPAGPGLPAKSKPKAERTYLLQRKLSRGLVYAACIVLSVVFVAPFLWSILSSLKGPSEIYVFPPSWLPKDPRWNTYIEVWRQVPFGRFYWNTIFITVFSTFGAVLSSTLIAYGFARFEFPGRNALFMVVIATLILPQQVTLIPRYLIFRQLKWLDSYLPLIVPNYFAGNAFFIFMLRQFLMGIPRALDEAAEIDGASPLRILWRILFPALKPAVASIAIFSFLFNWNDFIRPLIYLNTTEKYTLALGLRHFQQQPEVGGDPPEPYLMAASLMVALPPILLFFVAQRFFVRGVVLSGIKG